MARIWAGGGEPTKCPLTYDRRLQVHKDSPRHMLASPVLLMVLKGVSAAPQCLVAGHSATGLDVVLQAVELPVGTTHLHPSLTHRDRDTLML